MPTLLLIGLIFTTLIAAIRMGAWFVTMILLLNRNQKTLDEIQRLNQTPLKVMLGGIEHLVILATLIGIFIFIF